MNTSSSMNHYTYSLSGTPAEAGVRVGIPCITLLTIKVSVEPPPKQGCEWNNVRHFSQSWCVSVEPPPKQGCEVRKTDESASIHGLSGTPAEAGVRADRLTSLLTD